jgi:hypothetical protein
MTNFTSDIDPLLLQIAALSFGKHFARGRGDHGRGTETFADSPLEGTGFEPVWGFSCQVVIFGL